MKKKLREKIMIGMIIIAVIAIVAVALKQLGVI